MTQTMTTTETSAFYLAKPPKSIFAGIECREYPSFEVIYGFLNAGLGVKLRKSSATLYEDEQTHYKHYLKNISWMGDVQYVKTTYNHSRHQWGRVNAERSLSGSLFHRPSRHSFFQEKYLDWDMVNCQLDIALKMGRKAGLANLQGLETYCANPKKCRRDIAEHYKLRDIVSDDGVVLTAMEQAKKLPIRLAFGGGFRRWKMDYNVRGVDDLPLILQLERELGEISRYINETNPHIREDLIGDEYFAAKSPDEQSRSVMGLFAQTWERIIQEECIAHLVRTYSIPLQDIIPSQDGMMPLKSQVANIDVDKIFQEFRDLQMRKFGFAVDWVQKPFDEAVSIPLCKTLPIDIFFEDLERGERHIASLIYSAFKNTVKYYEVEKEHRWYYLEKNGLWICSVSPPVYMFVEVLQGYIDKEVFRWWNKVKSEPDSDKRKSLLKVKEKVEKHYCNVGRPSFSSQLCKYLGNLLKDNAFAKKLDKTAGKFVFADGILNLKNGEFQVGFKPEDYITLTSSVEYMKLKKDETKMNYLREQLKKINNNNETHLEYMLSIVGHSFTGDAMLEKSIYYIVDGTENQKGDNGKTFLFSLLCNVFPEFVSTTDPKALEDGYAKAHKHINKWKGQRLVYCDEGTKKKVNAALLKLIGDGRSIENEIMFGVTEDISIYFKMFICTNHLPKIAKDEEAVYNRYKQVNLGSHFDRTGKRKVENPEKLEFIADPTLSEKLLSEYRDEIVLLIMEYAMRYYQCGIPAIPEEYLRAVAETKQKNNEFAVWWNSVFEEDANGKISLETVLSFATQTKEEVIAEAKHIGIHYNKDLGGLGSKTNKEGKKVYLKGGFEGWRLKKEEEEEEIGEEIEEE